MNRGGGQGQGQGQGGGGQNSPRDSMNGYATNFSPVSSPRSGGGGGGIAEMDRNTINPPSPAVEVAKKRGWGWGSAAALPTNLSQETLDKDKAQSGNQSTSSNRGNDYSPNGQGQGQGQGQGSSSSSSSGAHNNSMALNRAHSASTPILGASNSMNGPANGSVQASARPPLPPAPTSAPPASAAAAGPNIVGKVCMYNLISFTLSTLYSLLIQICHNQYLIVYITLLSTCTRSTQVCHS